MSIEVDRSIARWGRNRERERHTLDRPNGAQGDPDQDVLMCVGATCQHAGVEGSGFRGLVDGGKLDPLHCRGCTLIERAKPLHKSGNTHLVFRRECLKHWPEGEGMGWVFCDRRYANVTTH